jgi:uncharacterized coiled-coil DUF342 family protein
MKNILKEFVEENNHLPEVLSAAEIEENGVQLGEFNKNILKTVEVQTLYLFDFKKEMDEMRTEMKELKQENMNLKAKIKELEQKL